jgi:hypothetical protein
MSLLFSLLVFVPLGLVGVSVSVDALLLDLSLRAVGLALFAALTVANRRRADREGDEGAQASAESAEVAAGADSA